MTSTLIAIGQAGNKQSLVVLEPNQAQLHHLVEVWVSQGLTREQAAQKLRKLMGGLDYVAQGIAIRLQWLLLEPAAVDREVNRFIDQISDFEKRLEPPEDDHPNAGYAGHD